MIGRTSRRAWLALPLAFASHYALDGLPHAYFSVRDKDAVTVEVFIFGADALAALALTLWVASRQAHWPLILGSAFAATLLDLMNPVTALGRWLASSPPTSWRVSLHISSAYHVPFDDWLLGFGPSAAVLAFVAIAMYFAQARRTDAP